MRRRYQVFVSSTYLDLKAERQEVNQVLLRSDCIPAGMELFPASNQEQWKTIEKTIDDSDYYILIIAGRYGSITDGDISYTEREFRYAAKLGIPIIAFLHSDVGGISGANLESIEASRKKLEKFRGEVEKSLNVAYFDGARKLAAEVVLAMATLKNDFPRDGWVKGSEAATPEIMAELEKLRAEDAQAKLAAANNINTRIEELGDLEDATDETVIQFTYGSNPLLGTIGRPFALKYSWNEIFKTIGPSMTVPAKESALISILQDRLKIDVPPVHRDVNRGIFEDQVTLERDSWSKIVFQLRALGLIEASPSAKPNDKDIYWVLTQAGDWRLVQMFAQRK